MINTPTRDDSEVDDRALLEVIALSLDPRLQAAGPVIAESGHEPGLPVSLFSRTAGAPYNNDV